jgi:hypothetical protein
MKQSIINLIIGSFLITAFISCDQGPTLQSYIVDNQETNNFTTIDLPTSVVSFDESKLTDDQKQAYKSVKRLNFLGYRMKDGNEVEYKAELKKVKSILKDKKYKELMRMGNNEDGKVLIKYLGSETKIDELIVFGNANDQGFGILRVLGKNMQPENMVKLVDAMQNADIDENQLKGITEFFK